RATVRAMDGASEPTGMYSRRVARAIADSDLL
ncbi:MAG: hypothetical protein RLZZ385_1572, partial [Pseudomonadota bacterium]